MDDCVNQTKAGAGLFYASNFSVGVNVFFELNKKLAELMSPHDGYKVEMEEIHHTEKLDAPSGTAITLAEGIFEKNLTKKSWVNEPTESVDKLGIISKRIDKVPGTHVVTYENEIDEIYINTPDNKIEPLEFNSNENSENKIKTVYIETNDKHKKQNTFNETEQQLFIASFYSYLNYHKTDDYIVDLDNIWKWLGFNQKFNAIRILEKNFEEGTN